MSRLIPCLRWMLRLHGSAGVGNVSGRRNVRLTSTLGGMMNYILTGPGTGSLALDQEQAFVLSLTGTTAASNLVNLAPPHTVLDGIIADSAIGVINLPQVTVDDTFSLPGGVRV